MVIANGDAGTQEGQAKRHGSNCRQGRYRVIDIEGYLPRGDTVLSEQGLTFVLGTRRVIAGLEAGVLGMSAGGTREIRVPPQLAYGEKGTATIPPQAALRLVVKLQQIKKRSATR